MPKFTIAFALALLTTTLSAQTPAWYDHAVIYEIYPRSFQDSNGDGIGDLKGITQHLDYLQALGVDALWLTPFFPSPNLDFGYDISNYTDVAPEYGTMADWDELVREARKRNMRVLVDFVLNHSSDQHPWFKESRSSLTNPKRDWYVWKDGKPGGQPPTHWTSIFGGYAWTLDPTTNQWYYHIFLPQQPDLNWQSPGLRKAMFDVARFWLDHGADGFRLDATPYLIEDPAFPEDPHPPAPGGDAALKPYNSARPENHEVLRQLRAVLDSYPDQPVLLGESTTPDITGLLKVYGEHRDEIQLPMDFLYGNRTELKAREFKKTVDDAQTKLLGQTPVFFFSSHDHSRQWTAFGDGTHNDDIARLTAAMTLLLRGTALMYYGEELGMSTMPKSELASVPIGPNRPRADARDGERTPMQWDAVTEAGFTTGTPWLPVETNFKTINVTAEKQDPNSMLSWYTQLLKMRRTPLFQDGSYLPIESGNKHVFAYARELDHSGAVIILNMSDKAAHVNLTGFATPPTFKAVLISNTQAPLPTTPKFTVPPFSTLVCSY